MSKITSVFLLSLAASAALFADSSFIVPEIDGGSTTSAIALISGALLVVRALRRR